MYPLVRNGCSSAIDPVEIVADTQFFIIDEFSGTAVFYRPSVNTDEEFRTVGRTSVPPVRVGADSGSWWQFRFGWRSWTVTAVHIVFKIANVGDVVEQKPARTSLFDNDLVPAIKIMRAASGARELSSGKQTTFGRVNRHWCYRGQSLDGWNRPRYIVVALSGLYRYFHWLFRARYRIVVPSLFLLGVSELLIFNRGSKSSSEAQKSRYVKIEHCRNNGIGVEERIGG